jgi:hypothetical protein
VFAGLCIPEVFEQNSAPVKNFTEVGVMAERGWAAIEQMVRVVSGHAPNVLTMSY